MLIRRAKIRAARALPRLDALLDGLDMTIVPHDAALTIVAQEAFLKFGKGRHPARLNFGDCASYALAKANNLPPLFKGENFSHTGIAPVIGG